MALTLREVCGLTTEEIAQAFLAAPPTLAQRIVRAKAKIRDARIPYQVPSLAELPDRVTVAQALPVVRARLRLALDGLLPVDDTTLTRAAVPAPAAPGIDWRLDPVLAGAAIGQDDRNAGALLGGQSAPGDRIRAGAATPSKELT